MLWVRITVGDDTLPYANDAGSPAVDLLETKLLLKSTVSDTKKGEKFMCLDVKDHFLATPMDSNEFMRVKSKHIPVGIMNRHNTNSMIHNDDWVHIRVQKDMPGLKKSAIPKCQHLKSSIKH